MEQRAGAERRGKRAGESAWQCIPPTLRQQGGQPLLLLAALLLLLLFLFQGGGGSSSRESRAKGAGGCRLLGLAAAQDRHLQRGERQQDTSAGRQAGSKTRQQTGRHVAPCPPPRPLPRSCHPSNPPPPPPLHQTGGWSPCRCHRRPAHAAACEGSSPAGPAAVGRRGQQGRLKCLLPHPLGPARAAWGKRAGVSPRHPPRPRGTCPLWPAHACLGQTRAAAAGAPAAAAAPAPPPERREGAGRC